MLVPRQSHQVSKKKNRHDNGGGQYPEQHGMTGPMGERAVRDEHANDEHTDSYQDNIVQIVHAPHYSGKVKPPGGGALGGLCLESRPLRRIGDVGGMGYARAGLRLAGRRCEAPLPFGPLSGAPWYAAVSLDGPILAAS